MANNGYKSSFVHRAMLEARKLSDQSQSFAKGGFWSVLSLISLFLAMAVMASTWIGLVVEKPSVDTTQEKVAQDHSKALESIAQLSRYLAGPQEIHADLFVQLSGLKRPLEVLAQSSSQAFRTDAQSRDPNSWPGRSNVLLDDIHILLSAQEPLLQAIPIREALIDLYKKKGLINQARFPELSATRGFYLSSQEWLYLTSSEAQGSKMTWAVLAKGKGPWRQMNSQLAALEVEAKLEDDTGRGKMAQELLSALSRNGLLLQIQSAERAWAQAWTAQERILTKVENLPPLPQAVLTQPEWTWSRLSFPGATADGLLAGMACLIFAQTFNFVGYLFRRSRLRLLAGQWLNLTQALENVVRSVDAPLVSAKTRIETLSTEFSEVVDQLRVIQGQLQTKPTHRSQEDEAWQAAVRMQSDLESELTLLREKLLNIHLQFCSGGTRENLVYDLAFTTEAVETISESARDLGRSFQLLRTGLGEEKTVNKQDEIEALIRQVSGLKNSAKRVAVHLQELSGRLQIAVEDVPKDRRFDLQAPKEEQGRLRADTQI